METVILKKNIYGRNTYENVINTQFSQLTKPTVLPLKSDDSISNLFRLYDLLFYEIPKIGISGSHEFLIKESTNYVGVSENSDDIQALTTEISNLRKELLDRDNIILNLTSQLNIQK